MVGCHSHRSNLAVQDILKDYTNIKMSVENIMSYL